MYVLCQLTFIGKTVVTGSNGKMGKKKEQGYDWVFFDSHLPTPTFIPSYRLLGTLLHPPTPSLRNHFHSKKKNMLAQAIYFYVWEVIIIPGLP